MTNPEPIHPGEHLAEFMQELGITQYGLAKTIGVPPIRVHAIVNRRRSITTGTATVSITVDDVLPSEPRDFVLTPGDAQSRVAWTEPEFDGGANIDAANRRRPRGTVQDRRDFVEHHHLVGRGHRRRQVPGALQDRHERLEHRRGGRRHAIQGGDA